MLTSHIVCIKRVFFSIVMVHHLSFLSILGSLVNNKWPSIRETLIQYIRANQNQLIWYEVLYGLVYSWSPAYSTHRSNWDWNFHNGFCCMRKRESLAWIKTGYLKYLEFTGTEKRNHFWPFLSWHMREKSKAVVALLWRGTLACSGTVINIID